MQVTFAEVMSRQITRRMPPDELRKRVIDFFQSVNICVLSTCRNDQPRATPIEYYSRDTTFYMVADPGVKVKNILANPQVSIGISSVTRTDWTDWEQVRGAQVTGRAEILYPQDAGYGEAIEIYQWQHYAKARGWDLNTPPQPKHFIRVTAEKVQYRDLSLLNEGYARVQVLNLV